MCSPPLVLPQPLGPSAHSPPPCLGQHSQHLLLDPPRLAAVEADLVVGEEHLGQHPDLPLVPPPLRLALSHLEQPPHPLLVLPLQLPLHLVKQEPLAPAHPHLVPLQVWHRLFSCLVSRLLELVAGVHV